MHDGCIIINRVRKRTSDSLRSHSLPITGYGGEPSLHSPTPDMVQERMGVPYFIGNDCR